MRICLIIFILLINSLSCRHQDVNDKYIIRLGHQGNEKDIWHLSALRFAHAADSLSHGRIKVLVYPAEQLGSELDMIRSIRAGIVEMTITGESMQNWAGSAAFLAVPYLIRDSHHLKRIVEGEVGDYIAKELVDEIGVRPLAYLERGPRHLTSNRPVLTPDDLKGMVLRVPNVPLFVKVWQALGAKPTPMAFSEVFTALQQGTVEAQENPFALINSAGLYEVQKYLNLTNHVISWIYVVIGEKQFNKYPCEIQSVLTEAAHVMQEYHEREFQKQELYLQTQLKDKGMIFTEPDLEVFRKKVEEVVPEFLQERYMPLYMKILETAIEK